MEVNMDKLQREVLKFRRELNLRSRWIMDNMADPRLSMSPSYPDKRPPIERIPMTEIESFYFGR